MNNDPITPLHPLASSAATAVQNGLDDLQGIRDRLRGNIRALSAGKFHQAPAAAEPPTVQALRERLAADAARRGESVASTIDTAFECLRHQVVGDIVNAVDTIARLEQFNAQCAQANSAGGPKTGKAGPADVIDVQATETPAPTRQGG